MSLSDQIRNAITNCGLSLRQLADEAGVAQPVLSRFLSADPDQRRDIRLATADKLAEFFGLTLTAKPGSASPPSDKKKKSRGARAAAAAKSAGKSSSVAGTPARKKKPGSKSSSRGTVRRLTPEQMDKEIDKVERKKGKGRLRIAKVDE